MRLFKYLQLLVVVMGVTASAYASDTGDFSRYDEMLSERDWDALRDYVNLKRTINVSEKKCNLVISGDVRFDWRHIKEKVGGDQIRGHHREDKDGNPVSKHDFDVEFNLRFEYVCGKAWGVAHLEFDNTAGVFDTGKSCKEDPDGWHGSGHCDDLCLKKAYMGYNLCCECDTRFDIELGRRRLYDAFESEIQFLSQFDGVLLKYSSSWDCVADWYVNWGAFVVDETVSHFAWVAEVGFLNICDSCVDFKYSFIDWKKNGSNRCKKHDPPGFKFRNSQWYLAYHFDPDILCVPGKLFGAFLWNHSPSREGFVDGKTANIGWYIGFRLGEVIGCGDWAFEFQYQWVEAEAVPDYDMSGIGRGNFRHDTLTQNGFGNTNFRGFRLEGLYALTDNLTINARFEWADDIDSSIGGHVHYSQFRLEAIYAF